MFRFTHIFSFIFLLSIITQLQAKKPNFIIILTDDQGSDNLTYPRQFALNED